MPQSIAESAAVRAASDSANASEALTLLEQELTRVPAPDKPATALRVSELLAKRGELRLAGLALDRALAALPDDAQLLYRRGILALRTDHQQLSKAAEAEAFFERAITCAPHMAEAHFHLGIAKQVQTRHVEGIPHFQRALELQPTMAKAHFELAKSYCAADRLEEARAALENVLALDPAHSDARQDLLDLQRSLEQGARQSKRFVRFPNQLKHFSDLRSGIKRHVLSPAYPRILHADSKVVTFGSCFAGNIARAFREAGVDARNTTFGESINSTLANRNYIDWLVSGVDNSITRAIAEYHATDPNFPNDRGEHLQLLASADIVIMTVGVAAGFFHKATGELVIPRRSSFNMRAILDSCAFRTMTVQENAENLLYIVNQVRSVNPDAAIALTLSPVPLTATFEYDSAVVADCVSKATLRAAVDQVMRHAEANIIYWPSFEIVRWLGAYVPGMYGEDDGSTIHVSERAIHLITSLFIEELSGGTLGPSR